MSSPVYCKYCHQTWETIIRYEKHIRMCEFFYQQRRNPQPEMDERGTQIPNMRELYRYIKHLSTRLEKTEKELDKLKATVNSRQKRSIMVWLNKPTQTPTMTFEDWFRSIKATEADMIKVLNGDLTDGIMSCLHTAITIQREEHFKFPIRCFKQKPGTFYVYSLKSINDPSEEIKMEWKIMSSEQTMKMITHISRELRRKYYVWEKAQIRLKNSEDDYDHTAMDKAVKYEKKLNGDIEKRIQHIKKDVFSKLEEDLHVAIDIEFE